MKTFNLLIISAIAFTSIRCNQPLKQSKRDTRPKDEIRFLLKIDSLQHTYIQNPIKLNIQVHSFNRYAEKDLKNIKDWQMIVRDINESTLLENTLAKSIYSRTNPIYNLDLYAVIRDHDKINPKLDSINYPQADVVFFTYTTPQFVERDNGHVLETMKSLNMRDTVLVSGYITYLDEKDKVNFKKFFNQSIDWNVDFIITEIRKK